MLLTKKLYEHGGGEATADLLSQIAGNSTGSSTFIKKVASLRAYGLAVEQNRRIILTDLGLEVAAPTSQEAGAQALKAALQRIEIFSRIYDRHKGKLLPADEFLRNIIQSEFGIPRDIAERWVRSFKESARATGLLLDRPDGKTQVKEAVSTEMPRTAAMEIPTPRIEPKAPQPDFDNLDVTVAPTASGQSSRLEISGGRQATFYIPDKLTKRDAEKLKGTLTGLTAIIDSFIDDGANE